MPSRQGVSGKCAIYGIYDPRNRLIRYIGKTTLGVVSRWRIHKRSLIKGTHYNKRLQYLHDKLLKHGLGNLRYRVLEYCKEDNLSDLEVRWISLARKKGMDICNVSDGGGMRGFTHSEETRRKISEAKRGKPNVFTSEGRASFIRKQKARVPTQKQLEALRLGRTDPVIVRKMKEAVSKAGRRRAGIPLGDAHKRSIREAKRNPLCSARGTKQHLAKLDDGKVYEIRCKYAAGDGYSLKRLADVYGVTCSTIFSLIKGRTWKHVPVPKGGNCAS